MLGKHPTTTELYLQPLPSLFFLLPIPKISPGLPNSTSLYMHTYVHTYIDFFEIIIQQYLFSLLLPWSSPCTLSLAQLHSSSRSPPWAVCSRGYLFRVMKCLEILPSRWSRRIEKNEQHFLRCLCSDHQILISIIWLPFTVIIAGNSLSRAVLWSVLYRALFGPHVSIAPLWGQGINILFHPVKDVASRKTNAAWRWNSELRHRAEHSELKPLLNIRLIPPRARHLIALCSIVIIKLGVIIMIRLPVS